MIQPDLNLAVRFSVVGDAAEDGRRNKDIEELYWDLLHPGAAAPPLQPEMPQLDPARTPAPSCSPDYLTHHHSPDGKTQTRCSLGLVRFRTVGLKNQQSV
eukprot:2157865-Amphidinium_carterae.1